MTVPRLTTALSGPPLDLERKILDAMPAIEHWLRVQWQERETPFYASVDLRNSGFKLAHWRFQLQLQFFDWLDARPSKMRFQG